jgi:hypothetical protein
MATVEEMKAILILAFVLVVAATALAYGHVAVPASVTAVAAGTPAPSEPATLLLSGGVLLAAGSALRRFTI